MKLNELILKMKQIEKKDTKSICFNTPNNHSGSEFAESLDFLGIGFSKVNDPEDDFECYPHIIVDTDVDTSIDDVIDKLENIAAMMGNPDVMLHDCSRGLWEHPEEVTFV